MLLPGPLLRGLIPVVRMADLQRSVESIIVESWLHENVAERRILVVGGDPLLHLPLVRNGATLIGLATDARTVDDAHRLARRMGIADRVHFHVSDLLHLPFPAGHFDAVLCGAALARSTDELFILREMARVLKSGAILGLTLPSLEAAGRLAERLPDAWLVDDLRRDPVGAAGGSPPAARAGKRLQQLLREREGLRRLYQMGQVKTRLELLGLEIADHGSYLTQSGALFFEAFHALRSLDRRRGVGRWLYALLSPVMLGPTMIMDAARRDEAGYGLRVAALKRGDDGSLPRYHDEGGGLELQLDRFERAPATPLRG